MLLADPISLVNPAYRRYGNAMMALPGVTSVGWWKSMPDAIRVNVQTSELALLADRALADVVDGARIVISANDGGGEVPGDSWVRNPTNVLRAMSGLPGVVGWKYLYGYTLLAEDHERASWLRQVVSSHVDGTPVRVLTRADLP